jgi:hypothetical protein
MTYGVYVSRNRGRGRLVFRSKWLSEAIKAAKKKEQWPWVWVNVI